MRAARVLCLLMTPFLGTGALAHGTVLSQMSVAARKVMELFEESHPKEADQVLHTGIEKTGEERFLVTLRLAEKSFVYECGLDLPVAKKWGCRLKK